MFLFCFFNVCNALLHLLYIYGGIYILHCDGGRGGSCDSLVVLQQDGSLERLSSAEFVSLSQAVEAFVRDTEELCGRRSVSLRGALQSQANRFVHRFHEERKTKLRCAATVSLAPPTGSHCFASIG